MGLAVVETLWGRNGFFKKSSDSKGPQNTRLRYLSFIIWAKGNYWRSVGREHKERQTLALIMQSAPAFRPQNGDLLNLTVCFGIIC